MSWGNLNISWIESLLKQFRLLFFSTILEYADVIWDNRTQQEKHDLEKKIQLEAARIVTGTTKLVSVQHLYDEIGWETLDVRRRKHKLVLFYKMYNTLLRLTSLHWFLGLTRTLHVTVCVTQMIQEQTILAPVNIIILFFLQSFVIGTMFSALTGL